MYFDIRSRGRDSRMTMMSMFTWNRREHAFPVQHLKAYPVAVADGAAASGGANLFADSSIS
jgi:hypothetical protein